MSITRFYTFIQYLSLDVVAGAVAGALFFGRLTAQKIHFTVLIVLALSVWCIYTVDHLYDAARAGNPEQARHRFHLRHARALRLALIYIGVLNGLLLCWLPQQLLSDGLWLATAVAAHFGLQRFELYAAHLKEVGIAFFYTAGLALPSWRGATDIVAFWWFFAAYAILAFANLLGFALHERWADWHDGQPSLAQTLPNAGKWLAIVFGILILWILAGILIFANKQHAEASVLLCTMLGVLAFALFYKPFLPPSGLYRVLGDAVFLFPYCWVLDFSDLNL